MNRHLRVQRPDSEQRLRVASAQSRFVLKSENSFE